MGIEVGSAPPAICSFVLTIMHYEIFFRQEARAGLLKSPMFQAFDPAILDVYIEHGMYVDPQSGEVRLKSTPFMVCLFVFFLRKVECSSSFGDWIQRKLASIASSGP